MASDKQIAANRLNAQKSTGPRTNQGKRRSRRNAFRHGLTAESVVSALEDEAAYRKFERIVLHDYAPDSAVERGLVVRLASLLWRLRRAVAIESGLFDIQGRILCARRQVNGTNDHSDPLKIFRDLLRNPKHYRVDDTTLAPGNDGTENTPSVQPNVRQLAISFLRLENHNPAMLDLIGRYETRLWRQLAQTVVIIEAMRRGPTRIRRRGGASTVTSQFLGWRER